MANPKNESFQTERVDVNERVPALLPPTDETEDRFDLAAAFLEPWQAVVRWRVLVGAIVFGAIIIGLVVTLLIAPKFTARTQLEISREQKNITSVEGLEARSSSRDVEFYATQYALLRARSLAERVAKRLDVAKNDAFFEAHGAKPVALAAAQVPENEHRAARERSAIGLLLANVEVVPVRGSSLVEITYTSRSPELSAQVANLWIEEFISATMQRQYVSTADARRFLETRLADLRTRLEQSERDAVTFASSNDIITLYASQDANGRTVSQKTLASVDLEALNAALSTARADRISAQSRASVAAGDNSPEALTNPVISQLRAKRADLSAQYADVMVRFKPSYPEAVAIKQQMDTLDVALANELGRIVGGRRSTFNEARAREQQLEVKVAELKGELDRQKRASIQYGIYQRDADTNRQLYDALLQRYKEIGVAGAVGTSNIAVVDKAEVPVLPSSPKLLLNLAIALLLGLGAAAVVVFALERVDEGIHKPEDVRQLLRLPLLGNVPLTEENTLEALDDPKTFVSEAYFSIHSTLSFATDHGLPRSVVVTSTKPGEGKSTSSFALAQIIGRTGKRVLLIDGDMRSPSLHKVVNVPNKSGFANALAGDDPLQLTVQTTHRGVSVMTSGPLPPSPPELLATDRLAEVIAACLTEFDHVVIDAPPVLGLADSPIMGRAAEGVLFVVEAEKTTIRSARSSLQRLAGVGNRVFGVIVTKIDVRSHGYGYGYGYGYSYGYDRSYSDNAVPVKSGSTFKKIFGRV